MLGRAVVIVVLLIVIAWLVGGLLRYRRQRSKRK